METEELLIAQFECDLLDTRYPLKRQSAEGAFPEGIVSEGLYTTLFSFLKQCTSIPKPKVCCHNN